MKPYVICHMTMSIDGKVTGDFLEKEESQAAIELYYELNRNFNVDGYACGRVTMESSFTHGYYPNLDEFKGIKIERKDYIVDHDFKFYAIAYDRYGKCCWKNNIIIDNDPGYGNAHIIEVLSEKVKDEYLAYLQKMNISYIFAGKEDVDIALSLEKLHNIFGIKTLLLEGGSIINGAFLEANVIDELSLVIAPVLGDREDKALFKNSSFSSFKLIESKNINDVVYLRYKIDS